MTPFLRMREALVKKAVEAIEGGMSRAEFCRREGMHEKSLRRMLPKGMPKQVGGRPKIEVLIPQWVPHDWHETYRKLALRHDEDHAARWARRKKRRML